MGGLQTSELIHKIYAEYQSTNRDLSRERPFICLLDSSSLGVSTDIMAKYGIDALLNKPIFKQDLLAVLKAAEI